MHSCSECTLHVLPQSGGTATTKHDSPNSAHPQLLALLAIHRGRAAWLVSVLLPSAALDFRQIPTSYCRRCTLHRQHLPPCQCSTRT